MKIIPNETLYSKFVTCIISFVVMMVWLICYQLIYNLCFSQVSFTLQVSPVHFTAPTAFGMLFSFCILAPVIEELLFRHYPLTIASNVDGGKHIWSVACITSLVFGWMHGSEFNILSQGVVGLILAYVYLKNNRSWISAMIIHSLYNFMVVYGFKLIYQLF